GAARAGREACPLPAGLDAKTLRRGQERDQPRDPGGVRLQLHLPPPRLHHRLAGAGGGGREVPMVMRALGLVAAVAALAGCKPDFGTPASLVTEKRILAVRAEPPEVRPMEKTMLTAVVVSPDGTEAQPALDWALCLTPKP